MPLFLNYLQWRSENTLGSENKTEMTPKHISHTHIFKRIATSYIWSWNGL